MGILRQILREGRNIAAARVRRPAPPAAKGAKAAEKPAGPSVTRVSDGTFDYLFATHNKKEASRARRMLVKETGTIEWLRRDLRPNDVFYDIGANIGVYTIFAAYRLGQDGRIVAFEPHTPNASSLIENIFLNNAAGRVQLVSLPLTDRDRFDVFNYQSVRRASATSQFGRPAYEGEAFEPEFREVKYGVRVDTLVEQGLIPPPDLVKIDVDGLDYEVMVGMRGCLTGAHRPRSIQVELGSESKPRIMALCEETGYRLWEKHWSQAGLDFIANGGDGEDCPHYGIFSRD